MKISANGPGMMSDFIRAVGGKAEGRFLYIPKSRGAGYITGFNWGDELRMMIRNYYLNEDVVIEWTNEAMSGQDHVAIQMKGVFPSLQQPDQPLSPELASILICKQMPFTSFDMPANTSFGNVTISISQQYLQQLFGQIDHPVVKSVLDAKDNFVLETGISESILYTAGEMLKQNVPESIENHYYKLKCEELLCYIFALLTQREAMPLSRMHIDDIRAVYAIKDRLLSHLAEPLNVALQAKEAGMSEPKLRKLFKQTFGKNVFDYYQSARIQRAAYLLKEKRLSVSDVGYQLGFTNLSHFSRVFEEYIGVKPKKYMML